MRLPRPLRGKPVARLLRKARHQPWLAILGVVCLSGLAGWLIESAGMPSPWLAGAMLISAIAALRGTIIRFPKGLTFVVMSLLGMQIGCMVTWDTINALPSYPLSLSVLAATVVATTGLTAIFFCRVFGWDRLSSFLSAHPGALALNFVLAEKYNARIDRIATVQCLRLFFLVVCLPFVVSGFAPAPAGRLPSVVHLTLGQCMFLAPVALCAAILMERLRLPGGVFFGPLLLSAGLHLSGTIQGVLPDWLLVPAFLLLGINIGMRFAGITLRELVAMLSAGTSGFGVAFGVSLGGAAIAAWLTNLPFGLLALAFAPGATEVMMIIGIALHVDPAFIVVHQVARFMLVSATLPVIVKALAADIRTR